MIFTDVPLRVGVNVVALPGGVNALPAKLLVATLLSEVNPNLLDALSFPETTELPSTENCAPDRDPLGADTWSLFVESK